MAKAKSSPSGHRTTREKRTDEMLEAHYSALERLEERCRHELMDDEERQELSDRVLRLRRRFSH